MAGASQLYPQAQDQSEYSGSYSASSNSYKSLGSNPTTHSSLYPPSGASQQGLQNYSSSSFQAASGGAPAGGSGNPYAQQKIENTLQHHSGTSAPASTGSYGSQNSSTYGNSTYQQQQQPNAFGSSSGRDSQSSSGYPGSNAQSLGGTSAFSQSLNHPPSSSSYGGRDMGDSQYGSSAYGGASQQSLSAKLDKLSLKENSSDSQRYDNGMTIGNSMVAATSGHAAATQSLSGSGINALGTQSAVTMATSSSPHTSQPANSTNITSKSHSGASGKAPPNLPQGVPPMMGQNYIMGQPGLGGIPLAAFVSIYHEQI